MENALVGEEVCKCYEKIANEWLKKIPIEMVKYLLDYNAIEAEIDSDKNVSEKLEKLFEKYLISKSVYLSQPAVIAAMKNMEEKFLGSREELINVKNENDENYGTFRKILEYMLKKKVPELFNEGFSVNNENRDIYYEKVFRFDTTDLSKEDMEELTLHFVTCLNEQIVEDNKAKAKNIFLLNADFKETLRQFESTFYPKYSLEQGDDKKSDDKLYKILKYYFENERSSVLPIGKEHMSNFS